MIVYWILRAVWQGEVRNYPQLCAFLHMRRQIDGGASESRVKAVFYAVALGLAVYFMLSMPR